MVCDFSVVCSDLVSLKKAYDLIRVSDLTVSDCGYDHYEFCLLCAEQSLQVSHYTTPVILVTHLTWTCFSFKIGLCQKCYF